MSNTYPNPYRSARKDSLVDPSTCYNRECVSYTAWKIKEATGRWPKRTGDMNAKNWVSVMPKNGYRRVGAPKTGGKYVGIKTTGTYGHALWFEKFNKSVSVSISEYNYNTVGGYGTRAVGVNDYIWYEIKAPAKKPAPKPVKKVYHTVKKNEFLSTVAAKNKISMKKLLSFPENARYRRNPNLIFPGDKVRVK